MIALRILLAMLVLIAAPLRAGTLSELSADVRPHVVDIIEFNRLSHHGLAFGPTHPLFQSGWIVLDQGRTASGVSYRVYQKVLYGQPPVTHVELRSDMVADPYDMLFADDDAPDPQLKWAAQYRDARHVLSRYRLQSPGEVFVSGINVGGALAQHAAMVNGTRAVVFNSTPISAEAIRAGDHLGLEPGVIARDPGLEGRILHLRYFADLVAAGDGFQMGRQMMISPSVPATYDQGQPETLDLIRNHDATALFTILQQQADAPPVAPAPGVLVQLGAIADEYEKYTGALGGVSNALDAAKLVLTGHRYLDPYSENFAKVLPKDIRRTNKILSHVAGTMQALRDAARHHEKGEYVLMTGALLDQVMELGLYEYAYALRGAEKAAREKLTLGPYGKLPMVRIGNLRRVTTVGMLSAGGVDVVRGVATMFYRGTMFDQDALTSIIGAIAPTAAYGAAMYFSLGNHAAAGAAAAIVGAVTDRRAREMAETIMLVWGWSGGGAEGYVSAYNEEMARRRELGQDTIAVEAFFAGHKDRNVVPKIGKEMVGFLEDFWKVKKPVAAPRRPGWTRRTSSTYREVCTRGVCTRSTPGGAVIPSRQRTASEQILATIGPYRPPLAVPRDGRCRPGDCAYRLAPGGSRDVDVKFEDDDPGGGIRCGHAGGDDGACLGLFSNTYFWRGPYPDERDAAGDDDPPSGGGGGGNGGGTVSLSAPPSAGTTGPGGVSNDPQPSRSGNVTGLGGILRTCSFASAGCQIGD